MAQISADGPSAQACEIALRSALQGKSEELVKTWALALARHNGTLALQLMLDSKSPLCAKLFDDVIEPAVMNDPTGVLALYRSTPALRQPTGVLLHLFMGLAQRSPEQALATYRNAADKWPTKALGFIAEGWAKRDWRSAASYGLGLADSTERDAFVKSALDKQMANHFDEVTIWLATLSPAARSAIKLDWAKANPQTLSDYSAVLAATPAEVINDASNNLKPKLAALIEPEPATEAWLKTLPEGESRDEAMQTYVTKAAIADPAQLPDLLKKLPDEATRARTTSTIAGIIAHDDATRAMAFAEGLADPLARQRARLTVVAVVTQLAPSRGAAMIVATQGTWSESEMKVFEQILQYLAPDVEAQAALQLQDAKMREPWLNNGVSLWASADAVSAAQWLGSLPLGRDRYVAASAFAKSQAMNAPEVAMHWAMGLGDTGMRQVTILTVGSTWRGQAPADFAAWLQQAELDDATRQALTQLPLGKPAGTGFNFGSSTGSSSSGGTTVFRPY